LGWLAIVDKKLLVLNVLLTLVVVGLGVVWQQLPYPEPISPPAIDLSVENSEEIRPIYQTLNQNNLLEKLQQYEQDLAWRELISQYDYLNLAVLNHGLGNYQQTANYLDLAKQIDPNRDFFREN
jgi:hypothetical protein